MHLDLGHVGIYRGLAQQAGLNPEQEAELFEILQRKDRPELVGFLADARVEARAGEQLMALLDLNGPRKILAEARRRLGSAGAFVEAALADLETIAAHLARLFPVLPVNFDLAELRGYHYQTGVVFAAFVPGYGREVARGGRYDEIGKVFGQARPATGFSADVRVLARLAAETGSDEDNSAVFAPADDESDLHETIRSLRAAGRTVIQELPGQAADAFEMGCGFKLRKQGAQWIVEKAEPRRA